MLHDTCFPAPLKPSYTVTLSARHTTPRSAARQNTITTGQPKGAKPSPRQYARALIAPLQDSTFGRRACAPSSRSGSSAPPQAHDISRTTKSAPLPSLHNARRLPEHALQCVRTQHKQQPARSSATVASSPAAPPLAAAPSLVIGSSRSSASQQTGSCSMWKRI